MKQCQSCGQSKSLDDFHNQAKARDGKQSRCKVCNRKQRKAYYQTAHGKEKNSVAGKRWADQNFRKIFDYLVQHPCVGCGESDPIVLEFDHRDQSTKSFTIGSREGLNKSWNKILEEIEKCDVRCANCHRRRTAVQCGNRKLAWIAEA